MRIILLLVIALFANYSLAAEPSLFGMLAKAADKATPRVWKYTEKKDDFEGVTIRDAELRSMPLGSVFSTSDFKPELYIHVYTVDGRFVGVSLTTTDGLLSCNLTECQVRIKFDEQAPVTYAGQPVGDSYKSMKLSGQDLAALVESMTTAKVMNVRMGYFKNGYIDFKFVPTGLVVDVKPSAPIEQKNP